MIDIIDKPLGPFPHICLYIDMHTNYHIIFPLPSSPSSVPRYVNDVAVNLRKYVFPYFGIPRRLYSSMGSSFVDSLIEATSIHWPDAVAIRNGSKKDNGLVSKRSHKSKSLISDLFENCRAELQDVQLTPSACSDLLLSLQCKYKLSHTFMFVYVVYYFWLLLERPSLYSVHVCSCMFTCCMFIVIYLFL